MKKTLLAAALTVGFVGVAQADTSVTLYGILDAGVGYQRVKLDDAKATKTGLINGIQSGNRWGLRGTEDLGDGLRAVFTLESGFDLGNGLSAQGGRLFGRQATLGLAGDSWGQLDFGRQTNIASKYFGPLDPFGTGFGQAGAGSSFSSANTVRYDNMIMYQTPNFSGFQFGVGYSFNVNATSQHWKISGQEDRNTPAITTGLRYVNGPISLVGTYDQLNKAPNVVAGGDTGRVRAWNVGGAYDFEVAKLSLGFGQTRNGFFELATGNVGQAGGLIDIPGYQYADGLKANNYLVGLTAPIGPGKILASWQMSSPTGDFKDVGAKKQQVYSLGYTYDLSKRTNVYAIGSYAKNLVYIDGAKGSLVGVGLRHQF
ncbi:MAG: porin [Candidimonas sp.]